MVDERRQEPEKSTISVEVKRASAPKAQINYDLQRLAMLKALVPHTITTRMANGAIARGSFVPSGLSHAFTISAREVQTETRF